jgi:hypothetical protein
MRVSFVAIALAVAGLCADCTQLASPTTPTSIESRTAPLSVEGGSARTISGPAVAGHLGHEVPFKGNLEGLVTLHFSSPPLTWWSMSGSGNATHVGRFTVAVVSLLGSSLEHAAGYYTLTAANGDTVNAFFGGGAQTDTPLAIVEHATILGGSGRFAGATGIFTITRVYDPVTGTTTGSFEGTIERVSSANSH